MTDTQHCFEYQWFMRYKKPLPVLVFLYTQQCQKNPHISSYDSAVNWVEFKNINSELRGLSSTNEILNFKTKALIKVNKILSL